MPHDASAPALPLLPAMLVTDDKLMAGLWPIVGRRHRCEVTVLPHAFAAEAAFTQQRYDVVLVDLDSPNFDGLLLAASLRRVYSDLDLPWIIGLKSDPDDVDADEAMEAGINALISRTGDVERIARTLSEARQALDLHRELEAVND